MNCVRESEIMLLVHSIDRHLGPLVAGDCEHAISLALFDTATKPKKEGPLFELGIDEGLRQAMRAIRERVSQDRLPLISLLQAEPLQMQSSHLSFQLVWRQPNAVRSVKKNLISRGLSNPVFSTFTGQTAREFSSSVSRFCRHETKACKKFPKNVNFTKGF